MARHGNAQEPSLAGVAGGVAGAASEAPARASFELSVAVLLERAKLMFLSSRAPVPVREPRLCEEPATFELLVLAQTAIAELKPLCPALFDRSLPLSERPCGLLATEEAGGFLVRDAMGCPLLHREDALSYGETVRKRAAKAAKEITAAEKACRGPYANAAEPRRQLRRRMLGSGCCELLTCRPAAIPPVRDAPPAPAPAPAPPPPKPPSLAERWLKHHVTDDYTLEDYLKERAKCAAAHSSPRMSVRCAHFVPCVAGGSPSARRGSGFGGPEGTPR